MPFVALFFTAWLAATILPFSSEAAFTAALLAGYDPLACIVTASLGNCAGASTNYVIGRQGGLLFARRFHGLDDHRLAAYHARFARAERVFMLCSWLPVVGDPITLYLGLVRVPFGRFAAFVFTPRVARYVVIAAVTAAALRRAP